MSDERYLQIKQECANLPVEASKLIYCPFCGAIHERSLSVTRKPSGIVFNCFRAKCGRSGFVPSIGTNNTNSKKVKEYKGYNGEINPCTKEHKDFLQDKYGIHQRCMSYIRSDEQGFMMFPAYSPSLGSLVVGWQKRRFDGVGKKAIFYPSMDGPYYQFHPTLEVYAYRDPPVIYIVEDYISMMKVKMAIENNIINGQAISLMGTHLTDSMALFLAKSSTNVVFMLDNDATDKSIKYKNKYQLLWPNARVVMMQDDPKDTDINTLNALVWESYGA